MTQEIPQVSVIIPCYNAGPFLRDALDSVEKAKGVSYEIIIINDGSSEQSTIDLLHELESTGYKVIHQVNGGPESARNTGVKVAQAEYILFLDSDNMLHDTYMSKSLSLLQQDHALGVVYGNPDFFGDVTEERIFQAKSFDLTTILLGNYIDVCAMVRKAAWTSVGGFDESRLIIGYEDWDFWIMLGAKGWKFKHLDEKLYSYRIRANSLIKQVTRDEYIARMFEHIYSKHWKTLLAQYEMLFYQFQFYKADQQRPVRTLLKNLRYKFFSNEELH